MTLVTLIGPRATEVLYLMTGIIAVALTLPSLRTNAVFMLPYLAFHITNWRMMRQIRMGRRLNKVLATTSLAILTFGLSVSALLLL